MGGEWRVTTLGEVLTLQRGFDLPEADRRPGRFPVIASTGQVGTHDEAMVLGPGVVIGRSGSLGGGQFIEDDFWPLNTTLWVKDFKGNDPRFCYYLLRSLDLSQFNAGSGVPTLNRNHIHPLPVVVPSDLNEQRAIAHILGTLDDKIELNRRMNQTLEEMARAIFKSWFVDFDPVRAKAAVRREHPDWSNAQVSRAACPNLKPEIAELFPDEFENPELGEIPKGWRISRLGELIQFVKGKKPPTVKPFQEEGLLPVILIDYFENGSSTYAEPEGMVQCDFEDVLMVMDGASSGRVETGYSGLVGSTIAKLEPKGDLFGKHFLYYYLKYIEPETRLHLTGTSIPHADKGWLSEQCVILPGTKVILDLFEDVSEKIRNRILTCQMESHTLAALRDTLLPKLISGELRLPAAVRDRAAQAGVKDAEQFLKRRGKL